MHAGDEMMPGAMNMPLSKTKVSVVDDHAMVRYGMVMSSIARRIWKFLPRLVMGRKRWLR